MSLLSFMKQSVTVVTPQMVDDRGTLVPDWSVPGVETVVEGCSVQPGASSEVMAARQAVTYRWTVFAPAGTVIGPYDGVLVGGQLFQVDGAPKVWPSPTGRVSHVEVLLLDWEG